MRGVFPIFFVAVLGAVSTAHAQDLLFLAPTEGTVVAPGQTLVVALTSGPPARAVTLTPSTEFLAIQPTTDPSRFLLTVSEEAPLGVAFLVAQAEDGTKKQIGIDIEKPNSPIAIRFFPKTFSVSETGEQTQAKLFGLYEGERVNELTSSLYTRLSTENSSVATISPDGTLNATGKGNTLIKATHSDLSATAEVTVGPPIDEGRDSSASTSATSSPTSSRPTEPLYIDHICRAKGAMPGYKECPFPIWHSNTFDAYSLNTGVKFRTYFDTDFWGVRLEPDPKPALIHAFDKCYYVKNDSTLSYFVPFRSDMEWTAFIENHPRDVRLTPCTLHAVYASASRTSKGDRAPFSLPAYAISGTVETLSQTYGYTEPMRCTEQNVCEGPWEWTETITVRFVADLPTWKVLDEFVTVEPPTEIKGQ